MQEHPDTDFRIIRISLKDMKIYEEAKKIKKQFSKKDPRKDPKAKQACEKLANQYWERHNTSDNFLKTIHEYKVKIAEQT